MSDLANDLRSGKSRPLAQAITLVESNDPAAARLLAEIYPKTGHARIVGITGSPGSGKSTLVAAMAKLYASEVAVRATEKGVQIFGGYGFVKDFPAEKYYRDVKLCTIGEGTSEIQRMVIARNILSEK